jgi:hypothetical protein
MIHALVASALLAMATPAPRNNMEAHAALEHKNTEPKRYMFKKVDGKMIRYRYGAVDIDSNYVDGNVVIKNCKITNQQPYSRKGSKNLYGMILRCSSGNFIDVHEGELGTF